MSLGTRGGDEWLDLGPGGHRGQQYRSSTEDPQRDCGLFPRGTMVNDMRKFLKPFNDTGFASPANDSERRQSVTTDRGEWAPTTIAHIQHFGHNHVHGGGCG